MFCGSYIKNGKSYVAINSTRWNDLDRFAESWKSGDEIFFKDYCSVTKPFPIQDLDELHKYAKVLCENIDQIKKYLEEQRQDKMPKEDLENALRESEEKFKK